jgi:hypothetical protein
MRFPLTYHVAIVALISLGATALAQQPGQPGQPGGRFRGGPPGGGGGMTFGGMMRSRLSLLSITEVRKELELAEEQITEIEKVAEEFRAKYGFGGRPGGGGGPGDRGPGGGEGDRRRNNNEGTFRAVPASWYFANAQEPRAQEPQNQPGQVRRFGGGIPMFTPEQRAEMEKQRLERNREEKAKLAEILLPHQIKRLDEIFVQQAGVAALMDEDIANQLGISEAQKAKLAEVRQANDETRGALMREMFQGGGDGDREANRAKFEGLQKAGEGKLLSVLTPDQQKKFEAMRGKPFAMPENTGRFGGGNRGPGGNRPEGNNNF